MHERLAACDSHYAHDLEGSCLSTAALRRYDPQCTLHPNIERGPHEHLKMAEHGQVWDIHRFVLRTHGIRLLGPDIHTLVEPVDPDVIFIRYKKAR